MLNRKTMGWKPEPIVRWQAERIDDPLERLRFLRSHNVASLAPRRTAPWKRLLFGAGVILLFALMLPTPHVTSDVSAAPSPVQVFPGPGRGRPESFSNVWRVEESEAEEVYSNGLRIDNRYAVSNEKRFYQVLDRHRGMQPVSEWRSQPVGILYHTTESALVPFDPNQNAALKRLSQLLIQNLRDKRSYNFVIDRFGRVYRVVEETSAANHSGNSIWADANYGYLNLNNSFLGIAFEAQTADGVGPSISKAQVHAGRVLTEMLRAKYRIVAQNCVTHAQVSVNPSNMRIGWHTDWANSFPFSEMGLANNYDLPLASLSDFGFAYDSVFRKTVGPNLWRGLELSEEQLIADAIKLRRSPEEHRSILQERYRHMYSALKLTGALEESPDVTNTATQ